MEAKENSNEEADKTKQEVVEENSDEEAEKTEQEVIVTEQEAIETEV